MSDLFVADLFSGTASRKNPGSRIISASRRTDIPAFFAEKFEADLKAGFCEYPNPLYPSKIHRVSLKPEDVDAYFFWTRFGTPIIPSLKRLEQDSIPYAFLWTLNNYPASLEKNGHPFDDCVKAFCEISRRCGKANMAWRYDPLILNSQIDSVWHKENFLRILERLHEFSGRLIVSVVEPYPEARKAGDIIFEKSAYKEILYFIAEQSKAAALPVESCAMKELGISGIAEGRCIDAELIERNWGKIIKKTHHKSQRKNCNCHQSTDIGYNDTCPAGCVYCYARKSAKLH